MHDFDERKYFSFSFKFWKNKWKDSKEIIPFLFIFSLKNKKNFFPIYDFILAVESLKPSRDEAKGRCKILKRSYVCLLWTDREMWVNL